MIVGFIYPNDDHASVGVRERHDLFGNIVARVSPNARLVEHPSIRLPVSCGKSLFEFEPNSFFDFCFNETSNVLERDFVYGSGKHIISCHLNLPRFVRAAGDDASSAPSRRAGVAARR